MIDNQIKLYKDWIKEIALSQSFSNIVCHIEKHFNELENKEIDRKWVLSLINLIEILKLKPEFNPKCEELLERLYSHGLKNSYSHDRGFMYIYETGHK